MSGSLRVTSGRWCNKNSGIIERSPDKFNLCNSLDASGEERLYSMPATCFQASAHQGDGGEALINCSPTLRYLSLCVCALTHVFSHTHRAGCK